MVLVRVRILGIGAQLGFSIKTNRLGCLGYHGTCSGHISEYLSIRRSDAGTSLKDNLQHSGAAHRFWHFSDATFTQKANEY